MDRLIEILLGVTFGVLIITAIISFFLNFRIGPPRGLISILIDSIGKFFGV
jgi:hypothetical protein